MRAEIGDSCLKSDSFVLCSVMDSIILKYSLLLQKFLWMLTYFNADRNKVGASH